jgi:hypothetical protein
MLEIRTPIQGAKLPFSVTSVKGIIPERGSEYNTQLWASLATGAVLCLRFDNALVKREFEQVAEIFGSIKNPVGRAKDGTVFQYSRKRQIIDATSLLTYRY